MDSQLQSSRPWEVPRMLAGGGGGIATVVCVGVHHHHNVLSLYYGLVDNSIYPL